LINDAQDRKIIPAPQFEEVAEAVEEKFAEDVEVVWLEVCPFIVSRRIAPRSGRAEWTL
jgi:hypothetical protein